MGINVVVTYRDGRIEYLQFVGLLEMLDWQFGLGDEVELMDVYWAKKEGI